MLLLALLPAGSLAAPSSISVAFVSPADLQLYPLRVLDRDMLSILDLVYESVMRINDDRIPEPYIATGYEMLSDGKTWRFYLRDDVYFHDGRQMKASDVCATMDAIKAIAEDETIPDSQKGLFRYLPNYCSSWKADDDFTFTVQTNRPYFGLLYIMTFPILQAQSVWEENPPGTGPYRVEYYAPGKEIWLSGNQAWHKQPPQVSEINGKWFENTEAALQAFEAETVDIVMTRSMSATRYRGTSSTRADSYMYATQQLECLLTNSYGELKNKEMREVVAYAIDKSRLANGVYQNVLTTTDTLSVPGTWLYNYDARTYGYDVDKANQLLDSLGWEQYNDKGYRTRRTESGETKTLHFRLCYYDEAGSNLRSEAAAEIQKMLKAVGISTQLVSYSFEDASSKLKNRDYDLFLCAYNMDRVPDPNFILLPDGYGNYVYYRSDAMKDLCAQLRKSAEATAFQQSWRDIQALMAEDLPFLPLYWREGLVLTRYPYSNIRDIREYELLRGIEQYQ